MNLIMNALPRYRRDPHPEPFAQNPALPVSHPIAVYVNKALTRVLGRRAPRIDTSIRSLR